MKRYRPVFDRLWGAYQILYVASSDENFSRAERIYRNGFDPELRRETIHEYFRLRELWDTRQYDTVSDKQLGRLRRGARRFKGKVYYENLFVKWRLATSSEDKSALIPMLPMGQLSTILVA